MKPHITAMCCTYGRVEYLNDVIQMFLDQTYDGPKELLILNSFNRQNLKGSFQNVCIHNLDTRPPNLGACRNVAIELAKEGLIVIWDDDDGYLPNHLENFAKHYEPGIDWIWHARQFYMEAYQIKGIVQGSYNSLAFTKEAWRKAGGYPNHNSGEDREFISRLNKVGTNGKRVELEDRELSFLYHWGQGTYHISGHSDDQKGMLTGHDRIAAHTRDLATKGLIPTGDIVLEPKLKHNYVQMRDDFLAERHEATLK